MPNDVQPDKCERCQLQSTELELVYGVGWYCSTCRFIHKRQQHKRELDAAFASLNAPCWPCRLRCSSAGAGSLSDGKNRNRTRP